MKKINKFLELFEKCSDELKELAFSHSSYAHDHKTDSNERVEFLGDSILSAIVSDYLYKHCRQPEGKMSKIRANFVCTENLSLVAKNMNLEKRIHLGKSFVGAVSDAILADTVESMIGVMYLSFGMPSIASAVLELLDLKNLLKQGVKPNDYKSELQELIQANKQKLKYTCETYTTKGGQENFRASVFVDNEFLAYGQGSTKREAEQNSAHLALQKLKK